MINIQKNVPLKDYTTLKIGGPAMFFVEISNVDELKEAVVWAKEKNTPYLAIAGGSNLLISDGGYAGLIIKIAFSGIEQDGDTIKVKAGSPLQELVNYTIDNGLDGMSTMTGIPGSVGGAIYGSAGAYGDNIRDFLVNVIYFDGENIQEIIKAQYITGYRDSIFKKHKEYIILESEFSGFSQANTEELKREAVEIIEKRKEKYPPDTLCPGSFFKNIPIDTLSPNQIKQINDLFNDHGKDPQYLNRFRKIPAGPLLEVLGANGDQLGQIKVAKNHGNTFFNLGNGSAQDFWNLAKKWKSKVKDKFGIELETEVQLIGFKDEL